MFFGFSCGMLLWRLWRNMNAAHRKTSLSPWLLYMGLVLMLMFPFIVKGLYPLCAAATLAPLLVWCGSVSTCRDRFTLRVSEFLGWLSYPLYCVHVPILHAMREVYKRTDLLSRFGIPEQIAAVVSALILSVIVGLLNDKLQLQRRLTKLLTKPARLALT